MNVLLRLGTLVQQVCLQRKASGYLRLGWQHPISDPDPVYTGCTIISYNHMRESVTSWEALPVYARRLGQSTRLPWLVFPRSVLRRSCYVRNMAAEADDDILTRNHSIIGLHVYDDYDPFEYYGVHEGWIFYIITIGCPIAVFCGVLANSVAFAVLVRGRLWLKHEGYVYLAANFCTNVGILLFCTSSLGLTSIDGMEHYYPPNTSAFLCKMWHFLMSIFFASGWLCVALLFNVYLREHLIHRRRCGCPMFAAKYCTLFASKSVVGVIFSVLFLLGLPYLAIYEITSSDGCFPSHQLSLGAALIVESIVMWGLPFVFFLPIILLMVLCTKREGNTFGFSQIEERSVSDEQIRVVAVTLSSMTLFSQFVLLSIREVFFFVHFPRDLVVLAHGLSLGLQPILCFVILRALRDGFRSQLRNIRCCRRLFPSLDREEEAVRLSAIKEDQPTAAET